MYLELSGLSCLGEAFEDALRTFNSNTALIEVNRRGETARLSYPELRAEALRLASVMQAHGVEVGDRIAILAQNQSRWIVSAIAAFWSGAELVPLDYKLTAPEQAGLLKHCCPKLLVCDGGRWRALKEESLGFETQVMIIGQEQTEELSNGTESIPWGFVSEQQGRMKHRRRDDVACLVYSSGTGGTPKGCRLTHGNYLAQAQALGRQFPMQEGERYFSILPTNHAIDFMCGFILPMIFGGTVVHQTTLRPEFLVSTMQSYKITYMALVPLILKNLEKRIRERLERVKGWKKPLLDYAILANDWLTAKKPNHRLSKALLGTLHEGFGGHLKMIFCGGAFVDRQCAEFFYSIGLPVVIGYGLTEAGTVVTVNDLSPFRGDTVGRPVTGTEVEIRDKNREGVGEVWVRGPTVMKDYFGEPELTQEVLVDGWLRTGDLGKFDAAGHLKLFGRSRNMIVTEGGKNIYPEDIEGQFEGLKSEVEEFCIAAVNYIWPGQSMQNEKLCLILRLKDEAILEESTEKLIRRLNLKLTDYKRVSSLIIFDEEFPRTASMKIKRGKLAELLRAKFEQNEALRDL